MASIQSNPDYLTTPHHIRESFHYRIGKQQPQQRDPQQPANANGFPIPGVQSPSATSVMAQDYFVSNNTWSNIIDHGSFDYIVIGSGATALAFITEALRLDPLKKILCLERGDFWLPSHFQNLPLPFKMVLGGPSETFPWTLSRRTFETPELRFCHGSCPFFGGRTTFWSAWCPQPSPDLMRGFTERMIKTTQRPEFWKYAKDLLRVTCASDIDNTIYAELQDKISTRLELPLPTIPSASFSEPAMLAVGRASPTSTLRFNKFSTPGPMLALFEKQKTLAKQSEGSPLELMINCIVTGLIKGDDGVVRVVETSQGPLAWSGDDTKVILCAGAFPNATLLLNSFPECRRTVGKRITGHFLTHIAARVPIDKFDKWHEATKSLQIGAHYLAGEHPETKKQYHVQVTAIHSPNPETDTDDAARECPDYAAAATFAQLKGSEKHVVFVCASLGEFTEDNPNSHFRMNKGNDPTTNVTLQYTLTEDDRKLWDIMDEATYQTIEKMAGNGNAGDIEYWDDTHGWVRDRLDVRSIRIPGIVHEASSAYVGPEEDGGSLDELYRPHGVKNVFVTGGAIFPTAGSWNPTLTMCGFAQDLARRLQNGDTDGDSIY